MKLPLSLYATVTRVPPPRRRRVKPATTAALICAAVTTLAVTLYYTTRHLREWMPHIAAAAVTIGLTVTVVEAILRREAADRVRPRVEHVLGQISSDLGSFVMTVLYDYAGTHVHEIEPLPRDAISLLDRWLTTRKDEDTPRGRARGETLPSLLASARSLAEHFERLRETDREVMAPELVRAIDIFAAHIHEPLHLLDLEREGLAPFEGNEAAALDLMMYGAQDFFVKFKRFDDRWVDISDNAVRGAEARRALIRIARREGDPAD